VEITILIVAVLGVLVSVVAVLQVRRAQRERVDPRLDIVQVSVAQSGSDDRRPRYGKERDAHSAA
jgi:hypothetical protein